MPMTTTQAVANVRKRAPSKMDSIIWHVDQPPGLDSDRTINADGSAPGVEVAFFNPDATQGPTQERKSSDAVIMMVDDEPTTLEVIQVLLEDAGYTQFVTTSDSTRAINLVARTRPDMILLDLNMPGGVDGFDILSAIRTDQSLARIPVVILTSTDNASTRLDALELGATDFLSKPVDASELVLRVRNNLAVKAYQDRIRREREIADRLLLNILPGPIATRLKQGERSIADYFESATVLFADLVNFTQFAARTDAAALVGRLNEVFQAFDEVVEAYDVEKIKTIGDSYVVAGGLPEPCADHAERVVEAGSEMLAVLGRLNQDRSDKLEMRVGVHTGPLVAGVIGRSKFNYDLWGDTVNVASRMESQGVAGKVQISQSTKDCLDGRFALSRRDAIEVKGKGLMTTYLLDAIVDLDPFAGDA